MARDRALDRILKEMSATDRDAFMELSYSRCRLIRGNNSYIAIMQEPEYAVSMSHDKQEKVEAIEELIEFFKAQERYEECANLVKILNQIKEL